ncbi:hypothetical protein, partial [Piscinibacter sp.]|uniref:hypothetical protein n=1 Tax=Piscinibacter sp. TaxID=1903157 RepID=UPI002BB39FA3
MARSSILGGERAPAQPSGRDVESLGPSDRSDTGSDVQGELDLAAPVDLDRITPVEPPTGDSDAGGTGARGAALPDEEARDGRDIGTDRVQSMSQASDDDADNVSLEEIDPDDVADRAATDDDDDDDE